MPLAREEVEPRDALLLVTAQDGFQIAERDGAKLVELPRAPSGAPFRRRIDHRALSSAAAAR
jgi:hypothetical protein